MPRNSKQKRYVTPPNVLAYMAKMANRYRIQNRPDWAFIRDVLNSKFGLRLTAKQYKDRYRDPMHDYSPLNDEELCKLLALARSYGHQWTRFSKLFFTNRSANTLKNHFYGHLRSNMILNSVQYTNPSRFIILCCVCTEELEKINGVYN